LSRPRGVGLALGAALIFPAEVAQGDGIMLVEARAF
jgi:hypothetical protein